MLTSFLGHGWASSPERLAIAAAVTLAFAVLARALHGVNQSGALAGGLACFLLFAGAGPAAFATLASLCLTPWEHVSPGTDGGITIPGSIAGLAAGGVLAALATVGGILPWGPLWIPVVAGFSGMLIDSLLGATLQRRGWINNEAVNFFATLAAAGAGGGNFQLFVGTGVAPFRRPPKLRQRPPAAAGRP